MSTVTGIRRHEEKYRPVIEEETQDEPVGQRWGKLESAFPGRRRPHSPTYQGDYGRHCMEEQRATSGELAESPAINSIVICHSWLFDDDLIGILRYPDRGDETPDPRSRKPNHRHRTTRCLPRRFVCNEASARRSRRESSITPQPSLTAEQAADLRKRADVGEAKAVLAAGRRSTRTPAPNSHQYRVTD